MGLVCPLYAASISLWFLVQYMPSFPSLWSDLLYLLFAVLYYRIKPDVVAPGTNIVSTLSQVRTSHPVRSRKYVLESNQIVHDPLFDIRDGTSMSTPLVAGCAAILREVLGKQNYASPSAALIKALLINGAVRMPGVPTSAQGFGRVNLKKSVDMLTFSSSKAHASHPVTGFLDSSEPLAVGEHFDFNIHFPSEALASKRTFKITLVYTDPPGMAGVLQNCLNLVVIAPDGHESHGNGFAGEEYDEVNNVEQIVLESVVEGMIKVSVLARKITLKDQRQPFALAWSLS